MGHPRASYLHSMCLLHLSASRDTFPWTTHPHLLLGRPRVPLGDGFLGRTSSSLPLAQHWTLESVISPHHDVFTGLTLAQSSWKAGDGPSFFPRSRALPGSHHMLDGSCHYFFFFFHCATRYSACSLLAEARQWFGAGFALAWDTMRGPGGRACHKSEPMHGPAIIKSISSESTLAAVSAATATTPSKL